MAVPTFVISHQQLTIEHLWSTVLCMWYTVIFLTSSELDDEFGSDYATGWAREPLVPIPAEPNVFISFSASRQVMLPPQPPI